MKKLSFFILRGRSLDDCKLHKENLHFFRLHNENLDLLMLHSKNLDLMMLHDDSQADSINLRDSHPLIQEIADNLRSAPAPDRSRTG